MKTKTYVHWERIGKFHHHGISIPLFSLRTKKSAGIGEFLDLIPLIDWCKKVGFDILQLLPINDCGTGFSPYNPRSAFALDPIYISLFDLELDIKPFLKLNSAPRLLRNEVLKLKLSTLKKYFEKIYPSLKKEKSFQNFLSQNDWLEDYGKFKALKKKYRDAHYNNWPKDASPSKKAVQFYIFLQYLAFRQMGKVKAHAESKNVKIKGDIPILLSPDSVDVWKNPKLFDLKLSAGVPPDQFHPLGQNWGFPLFNWKEMEKDGYSWWKKRLKIAEEFYHIYRIDHVIGFFRMFAVPRGKKPDQGKYIPKDRRKWEAQGKKLLSMMIDATDMFPMAEDLGTVPKVVYKVLKELGICGTKVVRWERKKGKFIPFENYEPISMTTLSNHDMDLLGLWWKKYPSQSLLFARMMKWKYEPILSDEKRLKILSASHHTASLFHINPLQEYLALFPELVCVNPQEERINYPGTELPHNWTYRYRTYLDEITSHEKLAAAIKDILKRK